jgi:hypothetical protein
VVEAKCFESVNNLLSNKLSLGQTKSLFKEDFIMLRKNSKFNFTIILAVFCTIFLSHLAIAADNTPPDVTVIAPQPNQAVQGDFVLQGTASDFSGIYTVSFSVREPDGPEGIPIGYDDLEATYNSTSASWEYVLDTTALQNGNYVVFAMATDNVGNEGMSPVVPFSINNGGDTPVEQIEDIIESFDDGIESGDLSGTGLGKSAAGRVTAFGNMLQQAEYLIENGFVAEACKQLQAAYNKVDGQPNPSDFIKGSEAAALASQIMALIDDLNCM